MLLNRARRIATAPTGAPLKVNVFMMDHTEGRERIKEGYDCASSGVERIARTLERLF